jgi:hypothetical protein
MEHLTVELVPSILLAFFVGCILGCLLRQALSGRATADGGGRRRRTSRGGR